jgi:hypothetical protein
MSAGPIDLFMTTSIFPHRRRDFWRRVRASIPSQLGIKLLSFTGIDFHHGEGF